MSEEKLTEEEPRKDPYDTLHVDSLASLVRVLQGIQQQRDSFSDTAQRRLLSVLHYYNIHTYLPGCPVELECSMQSRLLEILTWAIVFRVYKNGDHGFDIVFEDGNPNDYIWTSWKNSNWKSIAWFQTGEMRISRSRHGRAEAE